MLCLVLVLVCSMSISAFAVNRIGRAENEITQSVQMTDNQKGEAAATRQKSSEAQTKTKQENMKKSDSESKTNDNSEEQKKDSKEADNKGAKENSTEKDAKEDSEKNTSKEEKSTKEEKNTEKKSEEITDASEATTKAAEEKTTEAAEKKTEAATEKTTEGKDSKEATSEEKAAEETQAEDDKNKEIAVTSISGPTEVQVGKTITLTGTSDDNVYYHEWSSNTTNVARVSGNSSSATVTGVSAGTATITHTYYYNYYGRYYSQSETYTVYVVETTTNITAAIYFLATPDGIPGSNDTQYWAPTTDQSTLFGKIDITNATWQGNKNIVSNVSSHITSWPDNSTAANWVINKENPKFNYILDSIWEAYKTTIKNQLGVNNLTKEDVTQITLKPFKISRNNSETENQYYHIDCTIDVKCKRVFTAKFWVKEPGASEYTQIDAKNYITGSSVEKTTNKNGKIGSIKPGDDGVNYVLDGWYPENSNGEAYDSKKIDQWNYSPSDDELADGTVNFYAHYSPTTTSIKLKKLVTGSMGDKQKQFRFTISIEKNNKDVKFKVGNDSKEGSVTVDLANNEESTLTEIPVGADVSITENDYSESGYTTSYQIDNVGNNTDANGEENPRVAEISNIQAKDNASAHEVVFTNNKEAIPDTGITLDSLPFITLLALSIAGGIFYLICRYKKRFV